MVSSVLLRTSEGVLRLPTWLGFACGMGNYLFYVGSVNPNTGLKTVSKFGTDWFGDGNPECLASTPGAWHWFITYPDTPADQTMTPAEIAGELRKSSGHPVIGNITSPEFPSGSIIFWPNLQRLYSLQSERRNVGRWFWQGRRWTYENGVLTLERKILAPSGYEQGNVTLTFSPDDVKLLGLLDPKMIQSIKIPAIIEMYHRLVTYVKTPENHLRVCAEMVPSDLTPSAFVEQDLKKWKPVTPGNVSPFGYSYEWELQLRRLIYYTRKDLHSVEVRENGTTKRYPLLIPPEKLLDSGANENSIFNEGSPYKCAWVGDIVTKVVGMVMSVFTLGAPTLVTLPMTLAQSLVGLATTLEGVKRYREIERWLNEHMVGYSAALENPSAIEKPAPADPTGLQARAEGLPAPSVRTNPSGWLIPLLLAGAVALLG